ncbi:flagellar basal body rod C-terminal domain-containing protein [Sulfurimonas sp.]|uniref:flagellar basal body rod C-terminal domain-containing protein n=1 Tax=Sulfurimonas sp. TaxID=2022749 RepID=UPI002AB2490D|nr:hypothetical protein [Sulfurimonas sp.]
MNISNNISSIQAHQTMMNTNANNIANVNSTGYIPSDTKIINQENSVSTHTRKADNNGSTNSQTDLSKELPEQIVIEDATEVNVTAIKTQDEMLGTLLDIKA